MGIGRVVLAFTFLLSLLIGVIIMDNNLTEALSGNTLTQPLIPNTVKGMFASMETTKDTTGDWLQLEKGTFDYLKKAGKVRNDIEFKDLSIPNVYEEVAKAYIMDLGQTFKIPTAREAALWSWRPGWYHKYKGNIDAIPSSVKGVVGKSARQVMKDRLKNLTEAGY